MSEILSYLKIGQGLHKNHVVELVLYNKFTGQEKTVYMSEADLRDGSIQAWPRILSVPGYSVGLRSSGVTFGGIEFPSVDGRLVLANGDGALDWLDPSRWCIDGRKSRLLLTGETADGTNLGVGGSVELGEIVGRTIERTGTPEVEISFDNSSLGAEVPLQPNLMSGFRDAVLFNQAGTNATSFIAFGTEQGQGFSWSFRLNRTQPTGSSFMFDAALVSGAAGDRIQVTYEEATSELRVNYNSNTSGAADIDIPLEPDELEHHLMINPDYASGLLRVNLDGTIYAVDASTQMSDWSGVGDGKSCTFVLGYPGSGTSTRFLAYNFGAWDEGLTEDEMLKYTGTTLSVSVDGLRHYYKMIGSSPATSVGDDISDETATLTNGAEFVSALGGGVEQAGQPLPIGFGQIQHATPKQVDDLRQIYSLHGGRVTNVDMFDGGATLTESASTISDLDDFVSTSPASSEYTVLPSLGYVRLGSTPVETLTGNFLSPANRNDASSWETDGTGDLAVEWAAGTLSLSSFRIVIEFIQDAYPGGGVWRGHLWDSGDNDNNDPYIRLRSNSDSLRLEMDAPAFSSTVVIETSSSIDLNTQHRAEVEITTSDGSDSRVRLILDGELVGEEFLSDAYTYFTDYTMRLGARRGSPGTDPANIDGAIHRAWIENPRRTETQLYVDFRELDTTDIRDYSGNNRDATWVNTGTASFANREDGGSSVADIVETILDVVHPGLLELDRWSIERTHQFFKPKISFWTDQQRNLIETLEDLAEAHGIAVAVDPFGLLYMDKTLRAATTVDARLYLDQPGIHASSPPILGSDYLTILDHDMESLPPPPSELKVGYSPVWTKNATLVGSPDADAEALLVQEEGIFLAPVSNGALKSCHVLAQEPEPLNTLFDSQGDALDYGRSLLDFYEGSPEIHTISTPWLDNRLRIGSRLDLRGNRFNLENSSLTDVSGEVLVVIGVANDHDTDVKTITAIGPVRS